MSLDRRAVIAALMKNRPADLLAVTGLGSATWDLASIGDDDRNFYLWGAMGGAAMVGLGIALAQPGKRVAVITGDGEMLMGLGALATIGQKRPANLVVIVFDNGRYGETGMQESHTAQTVDLVAAARACGIGNTINIKDMAGVEQFGAGLADFSGPLFARVDIGLAAEKRVLPLRDGVELKNRFRRAAGVT
jgi:thiamine pyrophosphate-dependent acetolactate synthase large subunit-like protein